MMHGFGAVLYGLAAAPARAAARRMCASFLYTGVALAAVTQCSAVRCGAIAQLVERLHGMQEVWGSNPHSSTPGQRPSWPLRLALWDRSCRPSCRPFS